MKLWAALLAGFLSGCSTLATMVTLEDVTIPPAGEYQLCTKITLTETTAEAAEKASALCGWGVVACGTIPPLPIAGQWHQVITDRPQSFNDHSALIRLGHEVLHNLGGVHR